MIQINYLISAILFFMLTIFIKKKEEKINFITTFFVDIIIFSCYNILISLFLKAINLNVTLNTLSIINYIISFILLYKVIKDNTIQKFYIKIKDIVGITIITVFGLILAYIIFEFPANVPFVQVDASNHYKMITDFFETGNIKLSSLCGSYINYGILFKIFFNPVANKLGGYYLFVGCEIAKLIFSGILFYLVIRNFIKTKISYYIAIILSIVYMIAYPLNGMLCGFVYLQMAINMVGTIFIIMVNYNKIENNIKNVCLFLVTFGIMFTYYILVPPVYIAIFLYELKFYKKEKIKCIKNILNIFLLPCLAGIIYFLLPSFIDVKNSFNPAAHMSGQEVNDGYIFVNYFAMFIFFLPFNVYHIIKSIKNKNIDFLSIVFLINVIYIIFALILNKFGVVGRYYAMKPYFMLWLIMLEITGISIADILSEKIQIIYKILTCIVFFSYIFGICFSVFVIGACDFKIFDKEEEGIHSMYDIYMLNKGIIDNETFELIYTNKELQSLKEISEVLNDETNIIYFEDSINSEWLKKILLLKNNNKYSIYDIIKNKQMQDEIIEYLFNTEEKVYIICYKNYFINFHLEDYLQKISEKLNLIKNQGNLYIYSNK